nr:MAG TPA: hypothetical protein [Caudoviricetes sp.]
MLVSESSYHIQPDCIVTHYTSLRGYRHTLMLLRLRCGDAELP